MCAGDMTQELPCLQVKSYEYGIGSGSVCSTRLKTGVGMPQLSVCDECSEVAMV